MGEALCEALYNKHVSAIDEERMEALRQELLQLMTSTEASVSMAGDKAAEYGENLQRYAPQLQSAGAPAELSDIVAGLVSDTKQVQESNTKLQSELRDNAREMEVLRKELASAREEAVTDPLTGLTNRKGLSSTMASALDEHDHEGALCMLMADIDHFKKVNDTYGHLLGDKVIKAVATAIKKIIKGGDTAARFGGEEFAIMLPNTPAEGAMIVAEHIRAAVEKGRIRRIDNNEPIDTVTISVGVAQHRAGESLDQLIERADTALYYSKEHGRNRVTSENQLDD